MEDEKKYKMVRNYKQNISLNNYKDLLKKSYDLEEKSLSINKIAQTDLEAVFKVFQRFYIYQGLEEIDYVLLGIFRVYEKFKDREDFHENIKLYTKMYSNMNDNLEIEPEIKDLMVSQSTLES